MRSTPSNVYPMHDVTITISGITPNQSRLKNYQSSVDNQDSRR